MSDPEERLRDRSGPSRVKLWVALAAPRSLIAGGILAVVFFGVVAVGVAVPGAGRALAAGDGIETLFQALVTATVTGVTLVVTLNQLVLSQELGAVGDQRERMDGALAFREDVADVIEPSVPPADPAAFLRSVIGVIGDRARTVRNAVEEGDEPVSSSVDEVITPLIRTAETTGDRLEGARFGEFEVISIALDFEYAARLYEVRRLRAEHGAAFPSAAADALEDLVAALELFGPAREHFKTLYFQWELVDLSRAVLTTGIPALAVAASMVLFVDADRMTAFGTLPAVVGLAGATAVVLAPFAVLLAYVLRIATVAKRTLSIGPFVLRQRGETSDIDDPDVDG